ncbi:hypothetical protein [Acidobacterium sp. S8]|uniref:hypothetical protein n=1 Tax=Acidobacterium sp. S8 TaxID=1641854 RepID=UPI00131DBA88|nr:hypothetical protein [Acidobacterium sp. S8]
MRPMTRMFVIAAALASSSAAFALSKVTVNVPFNFESHGKTYQAGSYDVSLDPNESILVMTNHNNPKVSAHWIVSPTEFGTDAPALSMKFDDATDGSHELHSIRLATRTTQVLDKRERHSVQREVSISGGR